MFDFADSQSNVSPTTHTVVDLRTANGSNRIRNDCIFSILARGNPTPFGRRADADFRGNSFWTKTIFFFLWKKPRIHVLLNRFILSSPLVFHPCPGHRSRGTPISVFPNRRASRSIVYAFVSDFHSFAGFRLPLFFPPDAHVRFRFTRRDVRFFAWKMRLIPSQNGWDAARRCREQRAVRAEWPRILRRPLRRPTREVERRKNTFNIITTITGVSQKTCFDVPLSGEGVSERTRANCERFSAVWNGASCVRNGFPFPALFLYIKHTHTRTHAHLVYYTPRARKRKYSSNSRVPRDVRLRFDASNEVKNIRSSLIYYLIIFVAIVLYWYF